MMLNLNNKKMKPQVENQIQDLTATKATCFCEILNATLQAADENTLRYLLEKLFTTTPANVYFDYGFGAHHVWVADIDSKHRDRVLFAEF